MFEIDDYVSYTNKGIFQIQEILKKRNRKREVECWYVLHNIKNDVETSITTPSTNPSLRLIMRKQDILQLINDMPALETVWDDDKRIREHHFEELLTSGDIRKWAQLSKTIYEMKKQKEEMRKSISDKDRFYFDQAEDLLYEEISLCFHIKQEEVSDFIFSKIKQN